MLTYKYPVHVTINGITLAFNGPDLDPVAVSHEKHPKDKEGDLTEYFLWKEGDTPATHRIEEINSSGWKIEIRTVRPSQEQDWWRYRIYWSGPNAQQFERKHQGGQWEPLEPVSKIRIKLVSENDTPKIEFVSSELDIPRIEHQGSSCSVTWNPATRRYQRTCTG
ncbi:MAG TPA: hypothetical protein VHF87_01325 [Methylomirabilota bacterium]|jgi:hypothetical protein|nr:hypothetical protein [Methylomirabilota bacterium]